jgi:hypothetical protein
MPTLSTALMKLSVLMALGGVGALGTTVLSMATATEAVVKALLPAVSVILDGVN